MNTQNSFQIQLYEFKNGNQTGKESLIEVKNAVWTDNGKKATFKIDTDFEVFVMYLSRYVMSKHLLSDTGILLQPESYILVKK